MAFGGLIGVGVGEAAKGVGDAISGVFRTVKGDRSAREEHISAEQIALIQQLTSEFAGRTPQTWWDSFVDGLNRLPRPLITISIMLSFLWAIIDPVSFTRSMQAFQVVPEELWIMWMTVVGFWFGSRLISQDIKRPRITQEHLDTAIELARDRLAANDGEPVALPPEEQPVPKPPERLPTVPSDPSAQTSVDKMLTDLIKREGGYVNHPADKGGPTKYGITMATLAAWRKAAVTEAQVKAMTQAEARDIYRAMYYLGPSIDTLPMDIQAHVFDIAVNAGPRQAVMLLQRSINSLGASLKIDGIIGPETRKACAAYASNQINAALVRERLAFYKRIVEGNPSQHVFLNGWTTRAHSFLPRAA